MPAGVTLLSWVCTVLCISRKGELHAQHKAKHLLYRPMGIKHSWLCLAARGHLDMLEGEQGVSGGQAVRALGLCRAELGQEAVHEEQALPPLLAGDSRVQPHSMQRHGEPSVRIRPALQRSLQCDCVCACSDTSHTHMQAATLDIYLLHRSRSFHMRT